MEKRPPCPNQSCISFSGGSNATASERNRCEKFINSINLINHSQLYYLCATDIHLNLFS